MYKEHINITILRMTKFEQMRKTINTIHSRLAYTENNITNTVYKPSEKFIKKVEKKQVEPIVNTKISSDNILNETKPKKLSRAEHWKQVEEGLKRYNPDAYCIYFDKKEFYKPIVKKKFSPDEVLVNVKPKGSKSKPRYPEQWEEIKRVNPDGYCKYLAKKERKQDLSKKRVETPVKKIATPKQKIVKIKPLGKRELNRLEKERLKNIVPIVEPPIIVPEPIVKKKVSYKGLYKKSDGLNFTKYRSKLCHLSKKNSKDILTKPLGKYELDHKISAKFAYDHDIDYREICSVKNLRYIPSVENLNKSIFSYIDSDNIHLLENIEIREEYKDLFLYNGYDKTFEFYKLLAGTKFNKIVAWANKFKRD